MRRLLIAVLSLVTFLVPSAAQQPEGSPAKEPSPDAIVPLLLKRAETFERRGAVDRALALQLAAYALDPEAPEARAKLARAALDLAESPLPDRSPAPATNRDPAINTTAIERDVDDLSRRLTRLERALDDDGRAETITRRLELDVSNLERELDRLRSDVSRLERRVR